MPRLLSVNVGLPREVAVARQSRPHRDLEEGLSRGGSSLDGSIWTEMVRPISKATAVSIVPLWFIRSRPTGIGSANSAEMTSSTDSLERISPLKVFPMMRFALGIDTASAVLSLR